MKVTYQVELTPEAQARIQEAEQLGKALARLFVDETVSTASGDEFPEQERIHQVWAEVSAHYHAGETLRHHSRYPISHPAEPSGWNNTDVDTPSTRERIKKLLEEIIQNRLDLEKGKR